MTIVASALLTLMLGIWPSLADGISPAYFMFEQKAPDGALERFVFELTDPQKIDKARDIIKSGQQRGVEGKIIANRVSYNPQWSFHLDPVTIDFFEMQIEVCDANVTYVEAHLDEIGGSTLPGNVWCPWSSRLTAEVTDKIDPKTQLPLP